MASNDGLPRAGLVAVATFVILDAIWLTQVAAGLFERQLGSLLRASPDLVASAAFYAIYAAGIVGLVLRPALAAGSLATAAGNGALLGLVAYATFDLTNLAILSAWTYRLAAIDMAWGTLLTAVASAAGYLAVRGRPSQRA